MRHARPSSEGQLQPPAASQPPHTKMKTHPVRFSPLTRSTRTFPPRAQMEDGGGGAGGGLEPRSPMLRPSPPLELQQQQRGCKRPRLPSAEGPAGVQQQQQPQSAQQQQQQRQQGGGGNAGRQARMRVVVAAAIVAFIFAGCCVPLSSGFQVHICGRLRVPAVCAGGSNSMHTSPDEPLVGRSIYSIKHTQLPAALRPGRTAPAQQQCPLRAAGRGQLVIKAKASKGDAAAAAAAADIFGTLQR